MPLALSKPFLSVAACLALAGTAQAVSIGQMDDFEDLTTQGWAVGVGDDSPMTIANGGPAGTDDAFLQHQSAGDGGPLSRMIFFNTTQWTGDYVSAGVTGFTADVINLGATSLDLRLAFGSTRSARSGEWFASSSSVPLAPESGWQSVFLPIDEGSLTQVLGAGTYADLFSNIGAVRILSSTAPSNLGDTLTGIIGVDNLRAIPEPTGLALAVFATLAVMRRRV